MEKCIAFPESETSLLGPFDDNHVKLTLDNPNDPDTLAEYIETLDTLTLQKAEAKFVVVVAQPYNFNKFMLVIVYVPAAVA